MLAFKGVSAYDTINQGSTNSGNSLQANTGVKPAKNNEVFVTGFSFGASSTVGINQGFIVPAGGYINYVSSVNEGEAVAYYVQTVGNLLNPTWTSTTTTSLIAQLATYTSNGTGPNFNVVNGNSTFKGSALLN